MKRRESPNKASAPFPQSESEIDGGQAKQKDYGTLRRVFHRLGLRAPRWIDRKGRSPIMTNNGHKSYRGHGKIWAIIDTISNTPVSILPAALLIICSVLILYNSFIGSASDNQNKLLQRRRIQMKKRPLPFYDHKPTEVRFTTLFYPNLPVSHSNITSYQPDYGGLNIYFLNEGESREVIYHGGINPDKEVEEKPMDFYYSFDDDLFRDPYYEEEDKTGQRCRRTSWHQLYQPNCNVLHELSWMDDVNRYLDGGAYRSVFDVVRETPKNAEPEKIILKALKRALRFTVGHIEEIRIDALVAERFTSNPLFVDIFGHCGGSVLSEFMGGGNVQDYTIPGRGNFPYGRDDEEFDVHPLNDFTVEEKLDIALTMAESIAMLHGFKDGVIVHNDIQLCQFLFNDKGEIKFGDFNRAEVMLYDEENKEYCRYRNGGGMGNYRAYEEYWDLPLNEKIDVLSMGNNIYALLTGLWIYPENEDDEPTVENIKNKVLPTIDPRYRTRSFIEGRMVEIMYRCFVSEADDRASIFEVVEFLRATKKEHERRKAADPRYPR